MKLRMATAVDSDFMCDVVKRVTEALNQQGIKQWDEVYPDRKVILNDIEHEQLFVCCENDRDVAIFTLNDEYDEEYRNGIWHSNNFTILHRLCVLPECQNKGIGSRALAQAENAARGYGIKSIRLDAFSQNPYALRLYEKSGYTRVGEANFRMGKFYLYEKLL